jgi:hypothetical protein
MYSTGRQGAEERWIGLDWIGLDSDSKDKTEAANRLVSRAFSSRQLSE